MQSGLMAGSGNSFQHDGNFGLLKNKENKGNIHSIKTKREQKRESQHDSSQQGENL